MCMCSRCGKEFDEDEACEEFEMETSKSWDCLQITLCADCAIEAVENEDGDAYKETCSKCGKLFDPWEAETEFLSSHSDDCGADFYMFDDILCGDCADEEYDDISKEEDF